MAVTYAALVMAFAVEALGVGAILTIQPVSTHSLSQGEIVNTTVGVSSSSISQSIPIPDGPGIYEIHASTVSREDPRVAIGYQYDYWENTSSTDRFGTTWNNRTSSSLWSIYWVSGGEGTTGNLGYTDADSVVNTSFTVPENALSSSILLIEHDRDAKPSRVNVVIKHA